MQITRTSIISGNTNTMSLDITETQFQAWIDGTLAQDAMPHLTDEEREFLISGITPKEWADEFGEEK